MSKIECPVCGSSDVKILNEVGHGQLTLGPAFEYNSNMHKCQSCDEQGDFTGENDALYLESLKTAQKELQKSIIEDLGNMGMSMAYIERALELPQRTLARWKNGDHSAANLALLRILKSMPWIVDIADHSFQQQYITARMFSFLADKLVKNANDAGYITSGFMHVENQNNIKFEVRMDKDSTLNPREMISMNSNITLATG